MSIDNITPQAISGLVGGERKGDVDYDELQDKFAHDIQQLGLDRSLPISELVGQGKGPAFAKKHLTASGHSDWFTDGDRDFMGIYVWYHQEEAFYVGISRGVLKRLKQHVNGRSHFSASMAYKIARTLCDTYEGGREAFDPDCKKIGLVQAWLLKQRVALLPIPNPDHLALFEIYCSMKMQAVLNTFETH